MKIWTGLRYFGPTVHSMSLISQVPARMESVWSGSCTGAGLTSFPVVPKWDRCHEGYTDGEQNAPFNALGLRIGIIEQALDPMWLGGCNITLYIPSKVTIASANNLHDLPASKLSLFGFHFDRCTLTQPDERVLNLVDGDECGHYVVTPNVDHAVLLHKRPDLSPVYQGAALVVADGLPIVWASRWLGDSLPERVTGSDLVPAVFRAARRNMRVYLLGARPGVAQSAAEKLEKQYANVTVVGVQSPPMGFEKDHLANDEAVAQVAETAPDVLIIGLGAPKQELWAFRERYRLQSKVIFCAGATIDFLAGERKRAPDWCQRYGLEWAYRAFEEPRRLVPRYAEDVATFPRLLVREWLRQFSNQHEP